MTEEIALRDAPYFRGKPARRCQLAPIGNRFGNGIDLRGMMHTIRGTWAQVEVAAAGGCGEVMLCGMFIGKEVF